MTISRSGPQRPALRYFGGKWRLAPWILRHFPPHRIYVEPYGGAASVLLQKPRAYSEVYNDIDDQVVNVFRVLRDPAQAAELERLLRLTPYARAEWEAAYELTDDPVEAARRTIVRSFQGFGPDSTRLERTTGFRSNANRQGTVPAVDWGRYPDHVRTFTERLAGVLIDRRPALEVMLEHDGPGTLHYVDPPYPLSTRSGGRKSYAVELSDDDHRALAEHLHALEGYVALSGYDSPLYQELYRDWVRVEHAVVVFRQTRRVECLWLNPRCSGRLSLQTTLFDVST